MLTSELSDLKEKLKNHHDLPRHIGIIMDGNGRWAKKRGLPRISGHNAGIETVRRVVEVCGEIGVKYLTLYTFSEENWKRPAFEISALMQLLLRTINREIEELMEKNVKIMYIGNVTKLPENTRRSLRNAARYTQNNSGLVLNLALSYGSRTEITEAIRSIACEVQKGIIDPSEIDEKTVADHLQTSGLPDPDLIIRTSGEFRISNFLLWQMAYAEIYVTETLWPDFTSDEILFAIENYLRRERRFGMLTEQLHT